MLLLGIILGMTTQLLAADASLKPAELGKKALTVLASETWNKDAEVRTAAVTAWGKIGNPAPAPLKILHASLHDRNAHVRVESAFALHLLGDDSGVPVIARIVRPSTAAAENLEPEQEAKLVMRAKSRVRGIRRLTEIGGVEAVKIFESLLNDPSGEVRDATNIALAKMIPGEGFDAPFFTAVTDPDENVRAAALRALAEIGSGPALDALNAAAGDPSYIVREEAMRALSSFSSPETVRLLARGAKDQDKRVAAQALSGLAHIPDGQTTALLKEIMNGSKAVEVQLKTMAGLARRGDKVGVELADQALKQKDPDLRALGLDVLEAVEGDQSNALLLRTLEDDKDGKLRVKAALILVLRLTRKEGPSR